MYNELMSDKNTVYNDDTETGPTIRLTGINKYKNTIAHIEDELYTTLNYLNNQLDTIDAQTGVIGGVLPDVIPRFDRNVYDSKQKLVEQKLVALRSLASIAAEQVKVTDKDKGELVSSISDLFAN
jgi:hypothetical protein